MSIRTHRGFVVAKPAGADQNDRFYGNPQIEKLYLDLINDKAVTKTWEWQKEAIVLIKSIFDMTPAFFQSQIFGLGSPEHRMSPRNIDFLHSCLTFVLTGRRRMTTALWIDLLDFHAQDMTAVPAGTRAHFRETFGLLMTQPMHKLIPMWISHRNGLADLVTAAYIFFGPLPENWKGD